MAQQGVFGEVLHVEGAYIHNLEDFWPYYWNNWRMDYNQKHRGDVYATHGMGPACQVLNIHRGDRMKTLVAMDTKAVNGPAYIKKVYRKRSKRLPERRPDHNPHPYGERQNNADTAQCNDSPSLQPYVPGSWS